MSWLSGISNVALGVAGMQKASNSAASANAANERIAKDNRDFQERMSNTAHQREVDDLRKAGLNPILSANSGASTPQGSTATMVATDSAFAGLGNTVSNSLNAATNEYSAKTGRKAQDLANQMADSQLSVNYASADKLRSESVKADNESAESIIRQGVLKELLEAQRDNVIQSTDESKARLPTYSAKIDYDRAKTNESIQHAINETRLADGTLELQKTEMSKNIAYAWQAYQEGRASIGQYAYYVQSAAESAARQGLIAEQTKANIIEQTNRLTEGRTLEASARIKENEAKYSDVNTQDVGKSPFLDRITGHTGYFKNILDNINPLSGLFK